MKQKTICYFLVPKTTHECVCAKMPAFKFNTAFTRKGKKCIAGRRAKRNKKMQTFASLFVCVRMSRAHHFVDDGSVCMDDVVVVVVTPI